MRLWLIQDHQGDHPVVMPMAAESSTLAML
jgi:hypothetical protein